MDSPRCHHYEFAHFALRSVAFHQPLRFMALLATPDARDFIASLLQQVVEHCKGRGETIDFNVDNIGLYLYKVEGHPCAIVEMPPPRATCEAYYVATVLLMHSDPEKVELRFFTLEMSDAYGDPPRGVLGEWRADRHINHGVGTAPRLELFLQAISALLTGRGYAALDECKRGIFFYRVHLVETGPNRIQVMALLRRYWQFSLAQAKTVLDSSSGRPLLGTIGFQQRESVEASFREAGASIVLEAVEEA